VGGRAHGPREPRRRQDVQDAAARVFYERGYAGATVQEVAEAVGILKGSLYYYIEGKEDLLFGVLEQVHDEVDAILAEVRAMPDLVPMERLREYVTRMIVHSLGHTIALTVYYHDVEELTAGRRAKIYARRRIHEDFITEVIAAAQRDGRVARDAEPRLLARTAFATVVWIYRWYGTGQFPSQHDAAQSCVRFVIAGITGRLPDR
jgi:AcrR family transcriptional regulator